MTSSNSSTYTATYTLADVEKVMLNIKADLIMIADSTKAMTKEKAEKYAHDIELAAKNSYLTAVDVTLLGSLGLEVKAAKYFFQKGDEANGSSRPGGVRWPETPSGDIRVILHTTDSWKVDGDKVAKMPWKMSWGPTSTNTSHSGLTTSGNRGYSSNGFGANRNDFS
ncbi:hypothetical protein [Undibacterium sp.]|uniref:HORMA-1 domain-containing protein n=1 Tax=Undibacterium sp. TaxID=1914977 RepID=UPI0025F2E311|nr:hypothetical protein [Undibacterium sp.]